MKLASDKTAKQNKIIYTLLEKICDLSLMRMGYRSKKRAKGANFKN